MAASLSRSAKRVISSWSAVEAITNSTGRKPALGRAGGKNTGARTPAMPASLKLVSLAMAKICRLRWSQGLTNMPPKPWKGKVIWKAASNSGVSLKMRVTSARKGSSCSSVALGGTSIAPNTTPWSSLGASSLGENMYMGTTAKVSMSHPRYTAPRARKVAASIRA